MDETGAPAGNDDGDNPGRRRCWQWVMVTEVATVFLQGFGRSATAPMELLGSAFAGTVVSDRFSACNHCPMGDKSVAGRI